MVVDKLGVHVIEKLLLCFDEDILKNIYDIILNNFTDFANDSNSLCLIKKVIIHCTHESTKNRIFKIVLDNANGLIKNCYGNYAIQQCIEV